MSSSCQAKRPRLSLQTKSAPGPNVRSTKSSFSHANPKSPTAFNTLSNVYVTAIERSAPVQSTPLTAINLGQPLNMQTDSNTSKDHQQRIQTPYAAAYPDTPLSANPKSPMQMDLIFPSTMTATPPLSAGPVEPSEPNMFLFVPSDIPTDVPSSPVQGRRRVTYGPLASASKAPYTHPRALGLHSILRNSPLPPSTAKSPLSPRRQSLRLQEKAARRVGYESPLTQTITTERYTKSHIDLLVEEASPWSVSPIVEDSDMMLDLTMAYTGDETRDGGQTPGPFEEMRRRMAGLATETPISSPGSGCVRKRKRKEKKRKWVWTIGQDDVEEESGAMAAIRAAAEASTPRLSVPMLSIPVKANISRMSVPAISMSTNAATPEPLTAVHISVFHTESEPETTEMDLEMSDASSDFTCSRITTPCIVEMDAKTPTVPIANSVPAETERLGSVDLIITETLKFELPITANI